MAAEEKPRGRADPLARSTELGQSVTEQQIVPSFKGCENLPGCFLLILATCLPFFRCWELNTSMNIWWIVRSLILLAVVVILFSCLPRCSLNDGQIDSRH